MALMSIGITADMDHAIPGVALKFAAKLAERHIARLGKWITSELERQMK